MIKAHWRAEIVSRWNDCLKGSKPCASLPPLAITDRGLTMGSHAYHHLLHAFLDAIEMQDWDTIRDNCAPDLSIWHNVDQETKLFFEYLPFLAGVRSRASAWAYRETGYWEVESRFFRQSLLDVRSERGVELTVATFIIGDVAGDRITGIQEYYNASDIAPLMDDGAG